LLFHRCHSEPLHLYLNSVKVFYINNSINLRARLFLTGLPAGQQAYILFT